MFFTLVREIENDAHKYIGHTRRENLLAGFKLYSLWFWAKDNYRNLWNAKLSPYLKAHVNGVGAAGWERRIVITMLEVEMDKIDYFSSHLGLYFTPLKDS